MNIFRQYLMEIKKIGVLPKKEQMELLAEYGKTKNIETRNKIVEYNLNLVRKASLKYKDLGIPFLDLFQEGNIGLIKAVETFEIEKGFEFSTWAMIHIKQRILKMIASKNIIREPIFISDLRSNGNL